MTYPMFSPDESGVLTKGADGLVVYTPRSSVLPEILQSVGPWVDMDESGPGFGSGDALEAWRATAVVSRFQARVAMLDAGILADVEASLAGAGVLAQMAWAEATEFRRNSPMIAEIAAGLGLSPEQVDDLFMAAAVVVV